MECVQVKVSDSWVCRICRYSSQHAYSCSSSSMAIYRYHPVPTCKQLLANGVARIRQNDLGLFVVSLKRFWRRNFPKWVSKIIWGYKMIFTSPVAGHIVIFHVVYVWATLLQSETINSTIIMWMDRYMYFICYRNFNLPPPSNHCTQTRVQNISVSFHLIIMFWSEEITVGWTYIPDREACWESRTSSECAHLTLHLAVLAL